MTDRYKSLKVVLETETRDDDCEALMDAIRMLRGVLKVVGNVAHPEHYDAKEMARREFEKKLWDALHEGKS